MQEHEQSANVEEVMHDVDHRLTDDFMTSLKEYMDSAEVVSLNINAEGPIMSKEQAGFYMRKLAEVRAENAKINQLADEEIARITGQVQQWRERELNKNSGIESHFVQLLEGFAAQELAGETKKKSIKLPYGTVGYRAQQPAFEYDDQALVEHLTTIQANDLLVTKVSADKTALKQKGTIKDGQLFLNDIPVNGVTVTPREDVFYVK